MYPKHASHCESTKVCMNLSPDLSPMSWFRNTLRRQYTPCFCLTLIMYWFISGLDLMDGTKIPSSAIFCACQHLSLRVMLNYFRGFKFINFIWILFKILLTNRNFTCVRTMEEEMQKLLTNLIREILWVRDIFT